MTITILQEPFSTLAEYAQISIAFEVTAIFDITTSDNEKILAQRTIETPYLKDYDTHEHPTLWPDRYDITNWTLLAAYKNNQRVGGAVVAYNTLGLNMLEGRTDLAVLWDIRVHPKFRRLSVGNALFQAVEQWATAKGCTQIKIETQNNNIPACNFYQQQGCELKSINKNAYPELPQETQLLWYKGLSNSNGFLQT